MKSLIQRLRQLVVARGNRNLLASRRGMTLFEVMIVVDHGGAAGACGGSEGPMPLQVAMYGPDEVPSRTSSACMKTSVRVSGSSPAGVMKPYLLISLP